MTIHLTSRINSVVIAAAILSASWFVLPTAAMAQAAPAPAAGAPAAKGAEASNPLEARIRSLHAALRITAAEEPQWRAVADVMRDNAKTTGALIAARAAKTKTMSAIDDLNSYAAIAEAHAAGVKKLAVAFEGLYTAMSDAQKKNADAVFRRRPQPSPPKTSG